MVISRWQESHWTECVTCCMQRDVLGMVGLIIFGRFVSERAVTIRGLRLQPKACVLEMVRSVYKMVTQDSVSEPLITGLAMVVVCVDELGS